jgi:hypothetical protein
MKEKILSTCPHQVYIQKKTRIKHKLLIKILEYIQEQDRLNKEMKIYTLDELGFVDDFMQNFRDI